MNAPARITAARAAVDCERIGRLAVRSLYREVALAPKPGLVSPVDNGSHDDMDMSTFFRSLFALRHYFRDIARAGADGAGFATLQSLGQAAETQMLAATGGINTHRGAIFNLGLLCAAAGHVAAQGGTTDTRHVAHTVARCWGADILAARPADGTPQADSHGLRVARRHGTTGAREQAAAGFPDVIGAALPAMREVLATSGDDRQTRAAVQALFVLIARLDDSNLLWRGGRIGLDYAQGAALAFIEAGGVFADDWAAQARATHEAFVSRRLSPGGAADLLAVTLFLHELECAE
ncbi:MAG: triphosphoribosyl-dephospho-CoA synthase MdcB [Methyloversatilis discipulorum]|uniref:triphosphoribosyl-dephospho-CoA synthase MdcB n=1 Tax=Methyloversatilis discipulorum TaxID=1119528 RepID=UPI0026EE03A6|nr:triphosphoribosyl-dephospho-CoA synthase MdcB [Methyloversatilis discipulorum]MBT9516319.1 triphosphoribosyl-dephospho-CoA synthase MdcB [Methyloversatilis discipulorum]